MHTRFCNSTILLTAIVLVVSLGVSLAPDGRASAQPLPRAGQPGADVHPTPPLNQTQDFGMVYPLTVDSLLQNEIAILHASDAQEDDWFGYSVAISGDTLVVGSYGEDSSTGDPLESDGAVYVYERNQGGTDNWGEVTILRASDAQVNDHFGCSVALSGDTLVVGAYHKDGVVGDPIENAGAVYVYERDQGGTNNWGEVIKLTASDAQADDWFGRSVSISGDTLVVGADWKNGDPDVLFYHAGAVYVYERNQGGINNWGEVTKLTAFDAQIEDHYGYSVSISGDTLVVGAILEGGGVGDPLPEAGVAYVYERDQGGINNWGELTILRASDAQAIDYFGWSVSISGDTLVVGALGEDGGAGDPLGEAGAAYVYTRNQGGANEWGEVTKLTASDAQSDDFFGKSVFISEDMLVAGAAREDGGAGDPFYSAGAAYAYARNQGGINNWGELTILRASDAQARDNFGYSVSISGDTLIVGAYEEDGGTGSPIYGAGAAYIFQVGNVAPVLDPIGNQSVDEKTRLTFAATATDADGDTLSYSLAGAPSGAAIGSTSGAFSWIPTEAQGPGVYSTTVVVSDGALTDSETISITVNEVNAAPSISNIYNQCTGEGMIVGPLRFTVSDADIPTNTLTLDKASSNTTLVTPTNIVFGIDGTLFIPTLTITPTMGVTGTTRITITVSDGDLGAYDTFILAVGVNCPPEFTSVPVEAATVGVPYSYLISAIDADAGDVLTFTAPLSDTWLTLTQLTSRTATLDGTPPVAGAVPVVLQVGDGQASDTQTFSITIAYHVYLPSVSRDS